MREISQEEMKIIEEKIIKPMYEDGYFPLTLADKVTAILSEQSEQKEPCEWTLADDEANAWECSKCNAVWILETGTPKDNNMRFCPECGSHINQSYTKAVDGKEM